MAMEPITIFTRYADPTKVARKLRELCRTVKIDGPDDDWRNATIRFGKLWKKRTLTFTHSPDYYAEPNWSAQMEGMRGYFSTFPETERKQLAITLTTSFKFSLGTRFEPDFNSKGDPRLDILYAVATELDAVLFTPATMRDAQGRILFSAAGEGPSPPRTAPPANATKQSTGYGKAPNATPKQTHRPRNPYLRLITSDEMAQNASDLPNRMSLLDGDVMDSIDLLNQIKQQVIVAILGDDELGDRLVLKGGNLLQFAYQLTTRASKDVDISVDGEFPDTQALADRVEIALKTAFAKMKLVIVDFEFSEVPAKMSEDLKTFWGGYKCEFKLIDRAKFEVNKDNMEQVRRLSQPIDGASTKFKVDFSRHEFCGDKEEFVIAGYTIRGYSPRMFIAEKLRAICQQLPEYGPIVHRGRAAAARARDFVDIQVIAEHYGIDFTDPAFHQIILKTFDAKKVPIAWLNRIKNTREQHEPDFQSVKDTVAPAYRMRLQEFDFYFQFVCDRCSQLESFWDE